MSEMHRDIVYVCVYVLFYIITFLGGLGTTST